MQENITKAAAQLHITQPTLSRQLMQLEEELVNPADRTKRELLSEAEMISGDIAIGGGEFKSSECLARIVTDFVKEHEHVNFEIYSGNNDNIIEQMDKGLIDMGLFLAPIDLGKYKAVHMHILSGKFTLPLKLREILELPVF